MNGVGVTNYVTPSRGCGANKRKSAVKRVDVVAVNHASALNGAQIFPALHPDSVRYFADNPKNGNGNKVIKDKTEKAEKRISAFVAAHFVHRTDKRSFEIGEIVVSLVGII